MLPHPEVIAKRVASVESLRAAEPDVVRHFMRRALEDERITCAPLAQSYRLN